MLLLGFFLLLIVVMWFASNFWCRFAVAPFSVILYCWAASFLMLLVKGEELWRALFGALMGALIGGGVLTLGIWLEYGTSSRNKESGRNER